MAVLTLLALIVFSQILLRPQIAFASDRVALMALRDQWLQVAAGFGLRSVPRPREGFLADYRSFTSRSSVRKLLQTDPAFAALANKANYAFSRLETDELRGDLGATQAASDFDAALSAMALRVGDFAQNQLESFMTFFYFVGIGLVATIVGFVVLELRLRASSVGEARNRALSRALIAAQEGERLRISRELHDAVAQDLAAAKLYLGFGETPETEKASRLLERAIEEVRNICYGLRPAELDRLGISEAASRLCAETAKETGVEIRFVSEGLGNLDLEPETEINLYRILQEALSNVKRHAAARHVHIMLFGFGNYVELTVEDDGKGPGGTSPGLGRTGMEERARMIGGSFRFGFGPWGGSSLRVTAPTRRKEIE
jgi:signal transduction histidine kinase